MQPIKGTEAAIKRETPLAIIKALLGGSALSTHVKPHAGKHLEKFGMSKVCDQHNTSTRNKPER